MNLVLSRKEIDTLILDWEDSVLVVLKATLDDAVFGSSESDLHFDETMV